jgi:excisionase family DNA binding protein
MGIAASRERKSAQQKEAHMHSTDSLVPAAEARKILGISTATFYRQVAKGNLHAVKVGTATRVRQSEIYRFMAACQPLTARSGLKAAA